jgi:hypothetical protein
MKRLFVAAAALAALASVSVLLGTASAGTGGVSIVYDSGSAVCDPVYAGSPCFGPPNTGLMPGETTTLLVTVAQDTPEANATTTITWLAGALTFVSNGDSYASCVPTTSSVTCTYTDFAHGYKSDSFTFTVGPNAPNSVVTASITVTTSDGSDSANATIQMAPLPPPTSANQCKNGGWQTFTAPAFKNQGDCVSYVATKGTNPGNG